jgi:diguanylate cyclase (GGDEF)-like protein/PAS domain S-box-containing protein
MKPEGTPSDSAVNDEVSQLVRVLQETDERLEELTAGEVDAVVDRQGRSLLLRRAQGQLRDFEAAKQAAILNALPAHIALIDINGLIVSVNEAWRQFSIANVFHGPGHALGINYLHVCDTAQGAGSVEAREAAAGIRSVLGDWKSSFSMEYACHSPTERRWFLMNVTPASSETLIGAVVTHTNVTERVMRDEDLQRFRTAMEGSGEAIALLDRASMRYLDVNQTLCDLVGYTRQELLTMSPMDLSDRLNRADFERRYDAIIANPNSSPSKVEGNYRHKNGSLIPVESRRRALHTDSGWIMLTTSRDITERREAQSRILYLNRVYALLSGINTLIVRVRDREELFREACRIAVTVGGFLKCWIGMVDRGTAMIVPVASEGMDEEMLTLIRDRFTLIEDAPFGDTLVARSIRSKAVVVANHLENDQQGVLFSHYSSAGVQSIAALPLVVADEVVGVIALYSGEQAFFHEAEMKLLTELSGDIAFAIDYIEKRERLSYLAYYDVLTGLANRSLFLERVAQHMRGATEAGQRLAVFLIDLERFKSINDSLGRSAGDAVLRHTAEWLIGNAGDASLVARVGADQFAAVLPAVEQQGDLARLLEKWMDAFQQHPFLREDAVFSIGAKVGVALFPNDGKDADTLLKNAEAALKKAKSSGSRYLFYTQAMNEAVATRLTMENQLRQALENEEFVLHYQPKVSLASGDVVSAEALIRWNDPRTGLVPPGRFIPILEETGLIHEVGRWALRKSIEDHRRWLATGLVPVRVAVNVSPLQLRNRGFTAEIGKSIGTDANAASGLELEITESLIMEDVKRSIASLRAIRAMGITIAIDDFGTGFSSLSYLARLPVDSLKIDRSFVTDMTTSSEGLALVSTIINLAHSLKLTVVAEGVETGEQLRLLKLLNCDEMQGFHFSKPVPVAVFEDKFLRKQKNHYR